MQHILNDYVDECYLSNLICDYAINKKIALHAELLNKIASSQINYVFVHWTEQNNNFNQCIVAFSPNTIDTLIIYNEKALSAIYISNSNNIGNSSNIAIEKTEF